MKNNFPKSASDKFNLLSKRGTKFLGSDYPIMGGAMSWLSEANLVSAISNAGGFGVIACGSMEESQLRDEIVKTKSLTKKTFGVNLIVMHPRLYELASTCVSCNVSHVVLAGGLPPSKLINYFKERGIKVVAFAPTVLIAKRLVKIGVDALVIEGLEAGGHVGPVSTNVLAQEILPHMNDVPVFVAGGIGRGETMAVFLSLGASGIQMGTRFVCARESIAHKNFKNIFIKSNSRDAILTVQVDERFPVIPVRALKNKGTDLFIQKQKEVIFEYEKGVMTLKEAQLEIEHFWAGALKRAAIEGDIDYGSIMAGQSIGLINKEEYTHEIIENIIVEAMEYIHSSTIVS